MFTFIFFVLVFLVVFVFFKNETSKKSIVPTDKEGLIKSCQQTGGTWKEVSNPCDSTCDYQRRKLKGEELSCVTIIVPNCECARNKCWNGSSCEPL